MTNSEVLQFIIEELGKSPVKWGGDKELFELICSPLSYENETYQKRKIVKKNILKIFQQHKEFDNKKFDKLADNIICGENEQLYREELLKFLFAQCDLLDIEIPGNITQTVHDIPCTSGNEKNYRSNFNNWKNGITSRINRREVKHRLEQNFYFSPSLWDHGEYIIKQTIREGVAKFVRQQTQETQDIINIFEALRKECNMNDHITEEEQLLLASMQNMREHELVNYLNAHQPLTKYHTQSFIQKMVPLLYQKRLYDILLHSVIPMLDIYIQETNDLIKIQARAYAENGEYEKAFDLYEKIKTKDELEKIDIETEAISFLKRGLLNSHQNSREKKLEILSILIDKYDYIFRFNDSYHYYPAINLAYLLNISSILSNTDVSDKIREIHQKCLPSLNQDFKSNNCTTQFYANITKLEFILLKGIGHPIAELERYLELEEENIPLEELSRTQRQMQFFIDTVKTLHEGDHPLVERVLTAIETIDNFIEFREQRRDNHSSIV